MGLRRLRNTTVLSNGLRLVLKRGRSERLKFYRGMGGSEKDGFDVVVAKKIGDWLTMIFHLKVFLRSSKKN